ncbi:MAG: alanine--tRNA ligase [Flavobacteriales bacterium AspAUS03]
MKAREIRQTFLDFFRDKGHQIVPSASIVVKDDPTLLFTNAGMNPFKDYFLGYKNPAYPRLANTQKCLRVTGKHNDLDDVGHDTYHHTMFEMLGNWSFGDYFKKEAIVWAWELLTTVYKIPEENIYVTVFSGDTQGHLLEDEETRQFWKDILDEKRILHFGKKDNFWEMGSIGPCGPCSEIHVDLRNPEDKTQIPGRELVNQNHPQVIEIWNLVFIEFLRKVDGSLEILPAQHVDTGMGFERLCRVLQGKSSNYDTDIFTPLIREIEKYSGEHYGKDIQKDIAIRVVADHIRAITFAITDGQRPSNNGAGYVIRRILRRAISYAYRFLGEKAPFIYKLVHVLVVEMRGAFPELSSREVSIGDTIKEEEEFFLKTIDQGMKRMGGYIIRKLQKKDGTMIDGAQIFGLYDTYGFPIDLSRILAKENGLTLDESGFEKEMLKQKERSREASMIEKGDWVTIVHKHIHGTIREFLGYDYMETALTWIIQYRQVKTPKGGHYELVFNKTPFYPEGGGQVGDSGFIECSDKDFGHFHEKITILDTKKENDLILHIVEKLPQYPHKAFRARIDVPRRRYIEKNHTATHLLHHALREVLGKHVEQRGSYVGPDRLRFDFSHPAKLSPAELEAVEKRVEALIHDQIPLKEVRTTSLQKVLEDGAIALFGEKYGDTVRTIRFSGSIELCGGTHVSNTEAIQSFQILSESSVASGIRRIEALTSTAVIEHLKETYKRYNILLKHLNHPANPLKSVQNLQEENKVLRAQVEKFTIQKGRALKEAWRSRAQKTPLTTLICEKTDLEPATVKTIALELRKEVPDLFLLIGQTMDSEVTLCVALSDKLVSERGLNASTIIQNLAPYIGGKGGGKSFFAIAKGRDSSGWDAAIQHAKAYIGL